MVSVDLALGWDRGAIPDGPPPAAQVSGPSGPGHWAQEHSPRWAGGPHPVSSCSCPGLTARLGAGHGRRWVGQWVRL